MSSLPLYPGEVSPVCFYFDQSKDSNSHTVNVILHSADFLFCFVHHGAHLLRDYSGMRKLY